MYEAYFGLKRRPFAATPDPLCFLASGSIQAALDEIVVCVEQGQGIAVVSAPAGTGKTLLCEQLRSELGERFETVLLRHASFLTRRALLQTILCELNHSYRQQDEQELRLELPPAIRALYPQREALVLICDEAHQLSEDLLEELRILSDLAERGRPLVRLVLVGQLGLEETLALSSLEALSQRIRAHVCLETLTQAESLDYIDYRLTWAGGRTEEIFTPDALELASRAADGVPRCLNQLCDHALLLAYVAERQPVPAELIREALQDLRQLPLHWNESSLTQPTHREAASFTTGPDYAVSFETEPEHWDESLESTPSKNADVEADVEMESFEIGSDLPRVTASQLATSTERVAPQCEVVTSAIESPTESTDTNQGEESTNIDYEGARDVTMIESPWEWDGSIAISKMVPVAPTSFEPVAFVPARSPLSGGFVEEFVLDRYAAIDAGLVPPELNAPDTETAAEVRSAEFNEPLEVTVSPAVDADYTSILKSPEAKSAVEAEFVSNSLLKNDWQQNEIPAEPCNTTDVPLVISMKVASNAVDQATANAGADCGPCSPELSDLRTTADFDDVCQRLDELLPSVADDAGWDSVSLRAQITADATNNAVMAEFGEELGRSVTADSMEDWLGNEVCQLAEQLQQTIGRPPRENSPVEQLRSLLSPRSDEVRPASVCAETGADSSVEFGSMTSTETSLLTIERASAEPRTARPYRNLFSMLRRKQQGLL